MKNKRILLIFFIAISIPLIFTKINLVDADPVKTDIFTPLKQTPSVPLVDNLSKPNLFYHSNNLIQKPGSFYVAKGELLYIVGHVVDAFNVPLGNVLIKIWQTNAAGKYHSLLPAGSKYEDRNFLMSGQTITSNTGYYDFITIFPGFYDDRAPHINVLIYHRDFGLIETELYFEGHPRNENDPIYMGYGEDDRAKVTASVRYVDPNDIRKGKIATFNIVMDGIQQYKKY